jgi:hypothetical protein
VSCPNTLNTNVSKNAIVKNAVNFKLFFFIFFILFLFELLLSLTLFHGQRNKIHFIFEKQTTITLIKNPSVI